VKIAIYQRLIDENREKNVIEKYISENKGEQWSAQFE